MMLDNIKSPEELMEMIGFIKSKGQNELLDPMVSMSIAILLDGLADQYARSNLEENTFHMGIRLLFSFVSGDSEKYSGKNHTLQESAFSKDEWDELSALVTFPIDWYKAISSFTEGIANMALMHKAFNRKDESEKLVLQQYSAIIYTVICFIYSDLKEKTS